MICYNKRVWAKILSFYNYAVTKYPNSYTPFDAINDAVKSYKDKQFISTDVTKQEWIKNNYKVVRNKSGWYFAYYINKGITYIVDTENFRNMKEYQTQPMRLKQQMQYQPTEIVHNGFRLVKANNGLMNFVDGNNKLISNQWFSNYKAYKPFRQIQCICLYKCRWLVYGINLGRKDF